MRSDFDFCADEFEEIDKDAMYEEFLIKAKRTGESYVTTYDSYLDVMMELPLSTVRLLTWITFNAEMNTGKISMQSHNLAACLGDLKMAKSTFYKSLGELKDLDIIKGGNARYYINPKYIWKGTNDLRAHFKKVYPRL